MHRKIIKILNFLPQETIKSSELQRGDVYTPSYRSNNPIVVLCTMQAGYNHNNNHSFIVYDLDGGSHYLDPVEDIKIIKRGLFDANKMQEYIDECFRESEERKRLSDLEDEEERQREVSYLRNRLEDLDDEDE